MSHRVSRRIACATAAAVAMMAGPALAEDVAISTFYPARYRDAAMLHSLGIERLEGRDGPQVSLAIERVLSAPDARGETYFDLMAARRRGGRAEGTLSGVVTSGAEETPYKRTDSECVERKDGKCVRKEDRKVNCTRRVVNLTADLRIVRAEDGRIVYSASKPQRQEVSWCQGAGQTPPTTVEEMVAGLIETISYQVRSDISPRWSSDRIRFRESTKGLPKVLAKRFRASMKLSQRDLDAACADWEGINALAPRNPSILFDLGMCAESRGQWQKALDFYRKASPLLGRNNEADKGTARIRATMTALADEEERNAPQ